MNSEFSFSGRKVLLEREDSNGNIKKAVAASLAGLDSAEAWEMRDKLIELGIDKDKFLLSLAGIDSDKAWEWRDNSFDQADLESIALSLAGLDSERALQMRKRVLAEDEKFRDCLALSFAGSTETIGWRFMYLKKKEMSA